MSEGTQHHRRVVTGHTAQGRSTVVSDGSVSRAFDFEAVPGMSNELVWATDGRGRSIEIGKDAEGLSYVPEPAGTRLMIVRFPPDDVFASPDFDPQAASIEQSELLPGLAELFEPDAPGFHRTPTVDYGIVLEGEITLHLDDAAAVTLKAGDMIVQNATRHAWRNPTPRPATVVFVLVGAPDPDPATQA